MADTKTKGYSAVSAPGKVLLAGGYLVLDRAYTGLVFGLSARIHVIVQDSVTGEGAEPLVVVRSPQFVDAEWRYSTVVLGDGAGVAVNQLERYVIGCCFIVSVFIYLGLILSCFYHSSLVMDPFYPFICPLPRTGEIGRAHV